MLDVWPEFIIIGVEVSLEIVDVDFTLRVHYAHHKVHRIRVSRASESHFPEIVHEHSLWTLVNESAFDEKENTVE
jgi:hypothetical protein